MASAPGPRSRLLAVPALVALLLAPGDLAAAAGAAATPEELPSDLLRHGLAEDDECAAAAAGGGSEGCSLSAMQLRATQQQQQQQQQQKRQRDAADVEEPLQPPPLAEPPGDEGAGFVQGEGEGGGGGQVPAHCYWQPWLCGPDDWGWTTPAPSHSNGYSGWDAWSKPWNSRTPAPHPAPAPGAPTPPGYSGGASGLCAVMPWLCPAPTPAPARPPAPALPPAPPPASLEVASDAPLHTFYIYRVQNDENYPQPNHDMLNLAGGMWYLHNEVVWHANGRSGTYFSHPVTRIIKFRIQTRATEPLWKMGMNFGVFNAFDSGQCTGPFECDNFPKTGYVVGCETWEAGAGSNFPHAQWNDINHYKGATWYSLPGECPSQPFSKKTAECKTTAPGGQCPPGVSPTGTFSCTYQLEQLGELSIDEIVGIGDYNKFITEGGREYDPVTDKGVHTNFWDGLKDEAKCAERVKHVEDLFNAKYPNLQPLEAPPCDFNKFVFYPGKAV